MVKAVAIRVYVGFRVRALEIRVLARMVDTKNLAWPSAPFALENSEFSGQCTQVMNEFVYQQ